MFYSFDNFVLDTDRRELSCGRGIVDVEPQVFDLLVYLIQHRQHVVSREDLLASVWGGRTVSDSALNTRINAVRSAIGDTGDEQRLLRTLPRKGVRFVGHVVEGHTSPIASLATDRPNAPRSNDHPGHMPVSLEAPSRPIALPDRPSIAVLPFTNMSGDPEQEYFADGMAEEILTALSRCNWLFVIARNSSFTYKGKATDIRQVGRELGVRYVLEGSVRRGGSRLRFTGQLIDATSGAHIWADRFDGEMSDVFELQDRFAENVVAAIEPKLQRAEIERLKHKPAASLDAYDLLLRAHQLEYEFTAESLTAAIRCLEQALAIDPTFAPAMALAAYCYAERRNQGWAHDVENDANEGLRLAAQAVELGKDDGNVLWMAAFAVRQMAMDPRRAKELADLAMRLNPNSAIACAVGGWLEATTGNPSQARELLKRAQRLSPRDPRGWFMAAGMAFAYSTEENFEEAVSWAKQALVQNPRFAIAMRLLAANLAKLGRNEEAKAVMGRVLGQEPKVTLANLRARLMYLDEKVWKSYSDGLRLAGLPD